MKRIFRYILSIASSRSRQVHVTRLRGAWTLSAHIVLAALGLLALATTAVYAEPITLYRSFAGNINVTATGGTLRTQPNTGNACAVTNSGSMALSGIPAGSTITAAYLYWAGSGTTIDANVTFNGTNITADRTFTDSYNNGGSNTLQFFSGFRDVTALVTGNGTYTFANLTVTNTDQGSVLYCSNAAVLAGFSLVVIYERASEDLRVINVFDGFQAFRGGSITLTPSNFQVPTSPRNGRHVVISWEGDVENSAPLNGFSENLTFNGTALTDGYNPINSQYNSTVNTIPSSTTYGVDVDLYNLTTTHLSAGQTSATAVYSSGGDLVLLSNQTISVTNIAVAELSITKGHAGDFAVGENGVFTLNVTNNGPSDTTGTITVTDTLPAGLNYVSATGSGWTCGAAGQTVTCTRPSPLVSGTAAPPITLTTAVGFAALPNVTNSATVTSGAFDHILANNTASDTVAVVAMPGSGNKNLYLYGTNSNPDYILSRTPTTSTTAIGINRGAARTWSMNPVAAAPITIDPAVNATVPVPLILRHGGTTGNRSIRVDLQCSSGGTILTDTQTVYLTDTRTVFTFNLTTATPPWTTPITCGTGNSWNLAITNINASGTVNDDLRLYPYNNGLTPSNSRVELPATTVIDVGAITYHDAPYPGGNVLTTIAPGQTVYVRATVSDPFGSYDINANNNAATLPDITITSVTGTTMVTAANMTELGGLTTAGTKTFEYAYTIPAGEPAGNWTVRVDAVEGTEGTVSDFGIASLPVVAPQPLLTVVKSASGPTANPGEVVTYSVLVINTGAGAATAVSLDDHLSPYTAFGFDTYGAGIPFQFVEGTPASGLTLGTPVYSNDDGSTYSYPPSSGYDGNVTHWRVPMTGTMNPNGGRFTLRYQVQVK